MEGAAEVTAKKHKATKTFIFSANKFANSSSSNLNSETEGSLPELEVEVLREEDEELVDDLPIDRHQLIYQKQVDQGRTIRWMIFDDSLKSALQHNNKVKVRPKVNRFN